MPVACSGPKSLLSGVFGIWGVLLMTLSLSQCWEDPLYQLDLVFLLQDEEFFLLDVKLCCVEHGLLWDKPYQLGPHHREIQCLQRTSETGEKGPRAAFPASTPAWWLLSLPRTWGAHGEPPMWLLLCGDKPEAEVSNKLLSFWSLHVVQVSAQLGQAECKRKQSPAVG